MTKFCYSYLNSIDFSSFVIYPKNVTTDKSFRKIAFTTCSDIDWPELIF
jgi:hypothetical protein